ncbi:hypothetical protein PoB_007249100 [Plakobranchus ocellatus]|uniref:Uncharacterized protein n=1 Tax=Plakobranchus ocellatus TaxID=259542 RepID=A0AAV4DQ15_9GAST|nr:hypothetical protein PoB_007249100 [Plakobranchus ocellatus]
MWVTRYRLGMKMSSSRQQSPHRRQVPLAWRIPRIVQVPENAEFIHTIQLQHGLEASRVRGLGNGLAGHLVLDIMQGMSMLFNTS